MKTATKRWTGQATSARVSAPALGTASTAAGGVLSVLDVLLGTYTLWAEQQEGTLDMTSGVRLAKVAAGVAGSVDAGAELSGSFKTMMKTLASSGAARRVGRFLARTLPIYLEAATMGIQTWQQYDDVDQRGLQTISDPNYIGAFGAVVRGTGGILAGAAAWAGAWPLVAAGAAVYAGGQVLMWVDENLDEIEAELNDPLTDWLPTGTLWGDDANANREPFFQLVRPGDPAEKKALAEYEDPQHETVPKRLKAELDGFAEEAFVFPTRGHATPPEHVQQVHAAGTSASPRYRQTASTLENPVLRIVPRYLPSEGTLLVNAEVDSQNVPEPARVRCAVHYVSVGKGFRYKVMPITESGKAHPLSLDQRQTLARQTDPSWGQSVRREVTLPVTERRTEPRVKHTDTGKRMVVPEKKTVEVRKTLQRNVIELQLVDESVPPVPESPAESESEAPTVLGPEDVFGRRASEPEETDAVPADATGTASGRPAPKPQTVPAPGLNEVLRSRSEGVITVRGGEESRQVRYEGPRFQISGTVYFRVDQPVDPTPTIPTGSEEMEDEPVAFQYVGEDQEEGFVYPDDLL